MTNPIAEPESIGRPGRRPRVSVVIVTSNRPEMLTRCLESLPGPLSGHDAEVVVGCQLDSVTARSLRRRRPDIRVEELDQMPLGAARNQLVRHCTGDLVLFLDDDTTPDEQIVQHLVELADANPTASIFGGPNLTNVADTAFVRAQDAVLRSPHVGPVRHRFRSGSSSPWALCLCNLAIRRANLLPFDDRLTAGEETDLLTRMRRAGELSITDQGLAVAHERRSTLRTFARQIHKYGSGRGQATPGAAVGIAALAVALLALGTKHRHPAKAAAALYFTSTMTTAARTRIETRDNRAAAWTIALIPIVHATYPAGVIQGAIANALTRTRLCQR